MGKQGARAQRVNPGIVLDAGPLLKLDRNDRRVVALLALAEESSTPLVVPATALAQAMRNPQHQARLSRLLKQPRTKVVGLDRPEATNVGILLAATGTSDIADAHVVICARRAELPVATSDRGDIEALDPSLTIIPV